MSDADDGLPGSDLVERGLAALRAGEETVEGLLVSIGGPRLRRLGIDVPAQPPSSPEAEIRLYRRLGASDPNNVHSRYNALIGRLVSFERALEREIYAKVRKP